MDKNIDRKGGEQSLLPHVKKHSHFYIVFIAAFLGALLLWFYAIGYDSTIFERKISNVPVTVTGTDTLRENKEYMLAEGLELQITVTVTGRRSLIYGIRAEDLSASVDVSGVDRPGENTFQITVSAPNGVGVKELSSDSAVLYLDKFVSKTVPVNVLYSDYVLPEGLKLGEIEVSPIVTVIDGPESELAGINAAYVQLSLGEVSGPIAAYGQLFLRYDNGEPVTNRYIRLSSGDAYTYVNVYKEKTVPVVVSFTGGIFTSEIASISLSRQTLTISGDIGLIDSIERIVIDVDETAVDFNETVVITRYFSALLPPGISIESGEALVTAEITVPDITKRSFYIPPQAITVIQSGTETVVAAEDGVTVSIVGYREVLEAMTTDSIIASVRAVNVYTDRNDDRVAGVDFGFTDEIYGVYVLGDYTIKVSEQNITQQE